MTRRSLPAAVALGIVAVAMISAHAAQPRPNFSGRWIVVSPEKGKGVEQIVTHDAKALTVENTRQGPAMRQTYLLDGLEHKNTMSARGARITITYRAVWEKNALAISSSQLYPNGMKVQLRDVWSLDAKGQLVIDSTESGPGGTGPATRIVHVKKQVPSDQH